MTEKPLEDQMLTEDPTKNQIFNVKHCFCGGFKGFKLELKPSNLVIPIAHIVDFPTGKRFNVSDDDYEEISRTDYVKVKERTLIATCLSCNNVYELQSTVLTPIGDIQLKSSIGFSRVDIATLKF